MDKFSETLKAYIEVTTKKAVENAFSNFFSQLLSTDTVAPNHDSLTRYHYKGYVIEVLPTHDGRWIAQLQVPRSNVLVFTQQPATSLLAAKADAQQLVEFWIERGIQLKARGSALDFEKS